MRRERARSGAFSVIEDPLLHTLFTEAPDGIVVADRDGRCITVNDRFCELVGRTRGELLALSLDDLLVPADVDRTAGACRRLLPRAGGLEGGEWRIRLSRGGELTLEASVRTLSNGHCVAFVRGVPERRRSEAGPNAGPDAGEAERAWLQAVLETVPFGVVLFEPSGRLTGNRRAEELLGLRLSPTGGSAQYLERLRLPDGTPLRSEQLASSRVLGGESVLGMELRIERPDGVRIPVLTSAVPIRDATGAVIGGVGVFQDIGEQLRIRDSIRANEQLLAGIFERLPVGIQIADRTGHIVRSNPAGSRLRSGRCEPEGAQAGLADTGEPMAEHRRSLERALTEGVTSIGELLRIRCADGTFKTIMNAVVPLHDERGRPSGALVVDEDVTGLHETETTLRRAVQSRDEVLRIVSHDLRDPLQCIALTAQQLGEDGVPGVPAPALHKAVARILRASQSMSRLVDDLLDVASIEAGRLGVLLGALRVDAILRETLDAHQAQAESRSITLTVAAASSATILGDPGRLAQALSNILGNALKFTPAGGAITVRAEDDGDVVRITVTDTGPGIAPEHVARVFEPFWQSGPTDRRGRGLGLAIAKGIVEGHGGQIWLISERGRGTTVAFTIPKASKPALT